MLNNEWIKKVGLLFGSFNPIHIGHLIIANHVVSNYTNEIWFIVSPQNPFKKTASLLNAEQRLQLAQLAVKNDNRFKVCDTEFHLPIPSYTINTMQALEKDHLGFNFNIIIGSDNFLGIAGWKASDQILARNILLYERPGYKIIEKNFSNNIKLLSAPLLDISSTFIRTQIAEGKSIRYLVPDDVLTEIQLKGYYKIL